MRFLLIAALAAAPAPGTTLAADDSSARRLPGKNDAAVEAVRQWEYTPTVLEGEAVPVIMTVTASFRLS